MFRFFVSSILACALAALPLRAQTVNFSGKVTDRSQKPLAGALVKVEGTSLSAVSDPYGAFTLAGTAATRERVRTHASNETQAAAYLPDGRLLDNLRATVLHVLRNFPHSPFPLPKTAATHILFVSRGGYVSRSFKQLSDTRANLALSLYPNPLAAEYAAAKQACLDTVNALRVLSGLQALPRSAVLEAFADSGARYDSDHDAPHGHFGTQGKTIVADAENELPGWEYNGSLSAIVRDGTKMMWDEGPGGGHYENIRGEHTAMGCGLYVNVVGDVWVVQDFR